MTDNFLSSEMNGAASESERPGSENLQLHPSKNGLVNRLSEVLNGWASGTEKFDVWMAHWAWPGPCTRLEKEWHDPGVYNLKAFDHVSSEQMVSLRFFALLPFAFSVLASPLATRDFITVENDITQKIRPQTQNLKNDIKNYPASGLSGALVWCLFHYHIHGKQGLGNTQRRSGPYCHRKQCH